MLAGGGVGNRMDEIALSNWKAIKANDFGIVLGGPCNELPYGRAKPSGAHYVSAADFKATQRA